MHQEALAWLTSPNCRIMTASQLDGHVVTAQDVDILFQESTAGAHTLGYLKQLDANGEGPFADTASLLDAIKLRVHVAQVKPVLLPASSRVCPTTTCRSSCPRARRACTLWTTSRPSCGLATASARPLRALASSVRGYSIAARLHGMDEAASATKALPQQDKAAKQSTT